jgi:extradiol dioxygenase family protein
METLFHLSLPCTNAEETKTFYIETVGAVLGRHSNNWVDINLFGHQITFTQAAKFNFNSPTIR